MDELDTERSGEHSSTAEPPPLTSTADTGVQETEGQEQPHAQKPRADLRLLSHTVVDVRPFRHVPLFTQSSFLIDISSRGVLLEFLTEPHIKAGSKYWMIGHLTPLGITSIPKLSCWVECRWINIRTCRMGGLFVNLTDKEKQTVDMIIQRIREKSKQGTT